MSARLGVIVLALTINASTVCLACAIPQMATEPAASGERPRGSLQEEAVTKYLAWFRSCRDLVIRRSVTEKLSFEDYWRTLIGECEQQEVKGRLSMRSFVRSWISNERPDLTDNERELEITRRSLPIIISIQRALKREYERALHDRDHR